jgi:hypothetical protein
LDDCDKDTYGLEIAVDFIKGELIFGPVIWVIDGVCRLGN